MLGQIANRVELRLLAFSVMLSEAQTNQQPSQQGSLRWHKGARDVRYFVRAT